MSALAHRGPHRVLRGDLGMIGLPGQIFTPDTGDGLPAVAFGHGWMVNPAKYRDLMYHLASWGIVVAAPNGQKGILASDVGLAADLRSSLTIAARVSLGFGRVSVDPERLGVAGHGFGASAAVIAASDSVIQGQPGPPVKAVAALFPAPTTPGLLPAARTVTAPGLIVAGSGYLDTVAENGLPLALEYGADAVEGSVALRTVVGATSRGLVERRSIGALLGKPGIEPKTHAQVRAVLTGFLLETLTGDDEYQAFGDPEELLGALANVDLDDPPVEELDRIARLFGATTAKRGPGAKLAGALAGRAQATREG